MALTELTGNLHMHTPYSDGEWHHADIAEAALRAGLDFIIVTDHNVWVDGVTPYHSSDDGKRRVLVLTGEEVHDQALQPQSNHLLVYNAGREVAALAHDPQQLLDGVNAAGGLSFLAHPFDSTAPLVDYDPIHWRRWDATGFTGIELWNYMSEFVGLVTSPAAALKYGANPELGIKGPRAETLNKWDELTAAGRRIVAIGNSDAHGATYHKFGRSAVIFPYEMLFRAVNTHVLLSNELTNNAEHDSNRIYTALREGHCFVGYDAPGPTRGFRFSAQGEKGSAIMGDEVVAGAGVTLQVSAPAKAEIQLLRNGKPVAQKLADTNLTHITSTPGAYRVEVYTVFKGERRGWIFSNPIYIR
ncbi:MAG: PHP domain-containing protein [Chloroflexi bacterium]|nr:PHP domain-containing protein [Chloroflexota bacterium]MBI5830280.1 PHP domain-containing protein [Chloroflexota bacterium]